MQVFKLGRRIPLSTLPLEQVQLDCQNKLWRLAVEREGGRGVMYEVVLIQGM